MSDTQMQSAPAESQELSVGQTLKIRREARGLPLAQVAEQLKLTNRQLEAIESDDFDALPGNTFARGFVRNYARLLELDPQPLLDQLTVLLPKERIQAALPHVSDATALNASFPLGTQARKFSVGLMVIVGLLLGAGAVFWYLQQPPSPDMALSELGGKSEASAVINASMPDNYIASEVLADTGAMQAENNASMAGTILVVPIASEASASVAISPALVTKAASAVAAVNGGEIRVAVEFDSWVQITDADGQVLVSQLLKPGAERFLSGKAPFKIKIGNAPKTQLYYHGQRIDLVPYSRADVATLELK